MSTSIKGCDYIIEYDDYELLQKLNMIGCEYDALGSGVDEIVKVRKFYLINS